MEKARKKLRRLQEHKGQHDCETCNLEDLYSRQELSAQDAFQVLQDPCWQPASDDNLKKAKLLMFCFLPSRIVYAIKIGIQLQNYRLHSKSRVKDQNKPEIFANSILITTDMENEGKDLYLIYLINTKLRSSLSTPEKEILERSLRHPILFPSDLDSLRALFTTNRNQVEEEESEEQMLLLNKFGNFINQEKYRIHKEWSVSKNLYLKIQLHTLSTGKLVSYIQNENWSETSISSVVVDETDVGIGAGKRLPKKSNNAILQAPFQNDDDSFPDLFFMPTKERLDNNIDQPSRAKKNATIITQQGDDFGILQQGHQEEEETQQRIQLPFSSGNINIADIARLVEASKFKKSILEDNVRNKIQQDIKEEINSIERQLVELDGRQKNLTQELSDLKNKNMELLTQLTVTNNESSNKQNKAVEKLNDDLNHKFPAPFPKPYGYNQEDIQDLDKALGPSKMRYSEMNKRKENINLFYSKIAEEKSIIDKLQKQDEEDLVVQQYNTLKTFVGCSKGCELNDKMMVQMSYFTLCGHQICHDCCADPFSQNKGKIRCPFCKYSHLPQDIKQFIYPSNNPSSRNQTIIVEDE